MRIKLHSACNPALEPHSGNLPERRLIKTESDSILNFAGE